MKPLWNELKLFIAEVLIGWAFRIAPKTKTGTRLKKYIASYFIIEYKNVEP